MIPLTNREITLGIARRRDLSNFNSPELYPTAPVGYSDLQIIRCDTNPDWSGYDQMAIGDSIETWCRQQFGEPRAGSWLRLPYFGNGVCIFRVWGIRRADFMIRWYNEIIYEPEWLYEHWSASHQ